ncbi:DUF4192 domain-containing protein [Ruicaihuangia caeni]|uniref:DUF4192 domain-containing protein n=1 Tax=Ruicaihuangia caeni TaxID=3042517 RepID=A0AAW6T773_9MICO|nr:DUF4192 domain-containing protein [Klugiella sp. YN-L-19]MDI2097482.1 DUF4192 domain-containing protein [Klugiella sp. YN-L-19]
METIVKASRPEQLLAIVPILVGVQPVESAVFVAFRGKRSQGALRISLPPDEHEPASAAAAWAIGTLCKVREVDSVALVVYSSTGSAGEPGSQLVAAALHAADRAGFGVRDALWVGAEGWGSYFEPESAPRPLALIDEALTEHRAQADLPDSPSITSLAEVRLPPAAYLAAFDGALDRFDPPPSLERACDEVLRILDEHLQPDAGQREPMPAEHAAALVALSHSPVLRDVMMLHSAFGNSAFGNSAFVGSRLESEVHSRDIARSVLPTSHAEDSAAYAEALEQASRLLIGEGPRPDRARLGRAIEVFSWLAGAAKELAAPALTVLAWLHWTCGLGSVAGEVLDRARELEPDYGMAELLGQVLRSGKLPEWAFNPDA